MEERKESPQKQSQLGTLKIESDADLGFLHSPQNPQTPLIPVIGNKDPRQDDELQSPQDFNVIPENKNKYIQLMQTRIKKQESNFDDNASPLLKEDSVNGSEKLGDKHSLSNRLSTFATLKTMKTEFQMERVFKLITTLKAQQFVKNLMLNLEKFQYQILKKKHFDFIDDKAFNFTQSSDDNQKQLKTQIYYQHDQDDIDDAIFLKYKENRIVSLLSQFKWFFEKIDRWVPLIQPVSYFKLIWDFLIMVDLLLMFFLIPLQSALHEDWSVFDVGTIPIYITITALTIDTLISLDSGFFKNGEIMTDRIHILDNYIRNIMFVDFSSIIILISDLSDSNNNSYFILIFFLQLNRFHKINEQIQDSFNLQQGFQTMHSLYEVLVMVLFIAHMFASLWIAIHTYQIQEEENRETWLVNRGVQNSDSWQIKYLHALYFSIVTMVTVGFGDTQPITNSQIILCIATILISCGVFAYSINTIGVIFQEGSKKKKELKEKMAIINDFMEEKQISTELRFQIREYLSYAWREGNTKDIEQENKIIEQLSDFLRQSLVLEANKTALVSPILAQNFSQNFLASLSSKFREACYQPNEIIYQKGDFNEFSLYFVEKGSASISLQEAGSSAHKHDKTQDINNIEDLLSFKQGDCFGAYSFFTGFERRETIKSKKFTKLIYVAKRDFLSVLEDYPRDKEKYCYLRDEIQFRGQGIVTQKQCQSCNSLIHSIFECNLLHYERDQYKIIRKQYFLTTEQRNLVKRKKKKIFEKHLTLSNLLNIKQSIEGFQLTLSVNEDNEDSQSSFSDNGEVGDIASQIDQNISNNQSIISNLTPQGDPGLNSTGTIFKNNRNQSRFPHLQSPRSPIPSQKCQTESSENQIIDSENFNDDGGRVIAESLKWSKELVTNNESNHSLFPIDNKDQESPRIIVKKSKFSNSHQNKQAVIDEQKQNQERIDNMILNFQTHQKEDFHNETSLMMFSDQDNSRIMNENTNVNRLEISQYQIHIPNELKTINNATALPPQPKTYGLQANEPETRNILVVNGLKKQLDTTEVVIRSKEQKTIKDVPPREIINRIQNQKKTTIIFENSAPLQDSKRHIYFSMNKIADNKNAEEIAQNGQKRAHTRKLTKSSSFQLNNPVPHSFYGSREKQKPAQNVHNISRIQEKTGDRSRGRINDSSQYQSQKTIYFQGNLGIEDQPSIEQRFNYVNHHDSHKQSQSKFYYENNQQENFNNYNGNLNQYSINNTQYNRQMRRDGNDKQSTRNQISHSLLKNDKQDYGGGQTIINPSQTEFGEGSYMKSKQELLQFENENFYKDSFNLDRMKYFKIYQQHQNFDHVIDHCNYVSQKQLKSIQHSRKAQDQKIKRRQSVSPMRNSLVNSLIQQKQFEELNLDVIKKE